jgi:hypothetical protein
MVYPIMVTLKIKKVFEGGDLKAQVLTQCINFGIGPFTPIIHVPEKLARNKFNELDEKPQEEVENMKVFSCNTGHQE